MKSATRSFVLISLGQIISALGSGLTSFGFGIWILQRTGSVTVFGLLVVCVLLPQLLLAPFAGALADRYSRRSIMILADLASAVCTLALMAMASTGYLNFWTAVVPLSLTACASTFHTLAYSSSVSLLVEKQHLTKAEGVAQMGSAAANIVSPLLAGVLIVTIKLHGVLMLDCASYAVAAFMTSLAVLPAVPSSGEETRASILKDAVAGFRFMRTRPGLLSLNILLAAVNFALATAAVLKTPLLLSFNSPTTLGVMFSFESAGFLLGGIAMSAWSGSALTLGVTGGALMQAAGLFLLGFRPSAILATGGMLLSAIASPIMNGCSRVVMQRNTPSDYQGRVFAAAQLIGQSTMPIAALLIGPLADRVFKPILLPNGSLAPVLGPWFGVGPGRGMGLLLGLIGCAVALTTVWIALSRPFSSIEENLPQSERPPHPERGEHVALAASATPVIKGADL